MLTRLYIWLLAGGMALLLSACKDNDPKEIDALTKKVLGVEEGRNIQGLFSQSANLKAELTAPLMYRVRADTPYTEFPKTLHVDFYNDDHTLQSVVNAKYAKYYENQGKVYLKDSVVVFNTTGDTLYCDDLWWNQAQEIFYTDAPVAIRTRTQHLDGTGLWAKSNFSKYTIKNPVGIVAVPQSIQP